MKGTMVFVRILVLALTAALPMCAQDAPSGQQGGAVLVGTWYWQTMLPVAPGVQLPLPALVTYHWDGTVSGADGTMFGGLPTNPYRYTPIHGVWERAGHHEFRGTGLFLGFDAATGNLVAIVRSRSNIEFGADFDHIKGTIHLDLLSCSTPLTCPDPISAAPGDWLPYGPVSDFSFAAARLHIVPMP